MPQRDPQRPQRPQRATSSLCHAAVVLGAVAIGCSDGQSIAAPRNYAEGHVPLPGCDQFDYEPCAIRDARCQDNLHGIARCLRGGSAGIGAAPEVRFWSEAEAEADWLRSLALERRPAPDHFEVALTRFGLTKPSALSPEQVAARLAREVGAFYNNERKDIVVINHEIESSDLEQSRLLLHELVHALQDADHDLAAFNRRFRTGYEGNLRGNSVIEGEAMLHERRYFAAGAGLDVSDLDLGRNFDNLRIYSERRLSGSMDLYSASQGTVPYAHGAQYVYTIWSAEGQDAVRALFTTPPETTQEVLAIAWGGEVAQEHTTIDPPEEPEIADVTLGAWTSMGAWGVYLLALAHGAEPDLAQRLALAWRGDQLVAYALADGTTAARWDIVLSADRAATELVELVEPTDLSATGDATRVTLIAASASTPSDLFGPE